MTVNELRGALRVSENSLSEIAAASVCEIEGTVCGRKNVTVRYIGGAAEMNISMSLKKGVRALACAEAVQKKVRESIQSMTGITVSRVNVTICGQVQ